MPRNGDGSSDNGPIEAGENLIHGAGGDVSTALFRFSIVTTRRLRLPRA